MNNFSKEDTKLQNLYRLRAHIKKANIKKLADESAIKKIILIPKSLKIHLKIKAKLYNSIQAPSNLELPIYAKYFIHES